MTLPNLEGRVAVVTGASRGIGAALASVFAQRGLRLGLCARGEPALPGGDRVVAARVDVRDERAVETFARDVVERFGRIDLWVNNAGVLEPIAPARDVEVEAFRAHIDTNLVGVFLGTRTFVRHVRARGGEGVLINVSSGAAWSAYAGWAAYCAGKAAVERLTEVVALEEAEHGLRAYSVAPGVVDTQMQEQIRASSAEAFPMLERFLAMKRDDAFNSPEFVAEQFLAIAFDPDARPAEVAHRIPFE
ncbi:MAG: SDR family NAD(P)-dependent oxidoreductase [Myxococcota bacterium]|nr:SDR family NAD(P)-dependent oxidoreductase [Myxococcales bacterium]